MTRLREFPYAVKREVQQRLVRGEYESLRALSRELHERGYSLGKSALAWHRKRLLAGLEEIR